MSKTLESRFLSKVRINNTCWEWIGAKLRGGYGNINIDGHTFQAHRVSYFIYNGEIPDGMIVCHSCDNPSCVNPKHLFLGTHKINTQDKISKGRCPIGESISKLKECEVLEIRRYAALHIPRRLIAKMFGIGPTNVTNIVNRKIWKHI